jgi:hypothetical protein
MSCRNAVTGAWAFLLFTAIVANGQEKTEQADALALLAKIDGKATFDPAHPQRVIGIDI